MTKNPQNLHEKITLNTVKGEPFELNTADITALVRYKHDYGIHTRVFGHGTDDRTLVEYIEPFELVSVTETPAEILAMMKTPRPHLMLDAFDDDTSAFIPLDEISVIRKSKYFVNLSAVYGHAARKRVADGVVELATVRHKPNEISKMITKDKSYITLHGVDMDPDIDDEIVVSLDAVSSMVHKHSNEWGGDVTYIYGHGITEEILLPELAELCIVRETPEEILQQVGEWWGFIQANSVELDPVILPIKAIKSCEEGHYYSEDATYVRGFQVDEDMDPINIATIQETSDQILEMKKQEEKRVKNFLAREKKRVIDKIDKVDVVQNEIPIKRLFLNRPKR